VVAARLAVFRDPDRFAPRRETLANPCIAGSTSNAIAGVIRYWWLVKADIHRPLEYGAILAVLLGYRIAAWAGPKPEKFPRLLSQASDPNRAFIVDFMP